MKKYLSISLILASSLLFSTNPTLAFETPVPSIKKIIIDPGYGGKEDGPLCKGKGIKTKDINLAISKKLAQAITNRLGIKVILTRSDDTFLYLDERTAIANMENGDLFISIHTNASENSDAYGIETFIMNSQASEKYAEEIKGRDNPPPSEIATILENVLGDMMVNNKARESETLAKALQQSIIDRLKPDYPHIKNRGVKQAPFYVLIGANMPSIVIATGFVSNAEECERLASDKYQSDLAEAISVGIGKYIEEIKKNR